MLSGGVSVESDGILKIRPTETPLWHRLLLELLPVFHPSCRASCGVFRDHGCLGCGRTMTTMAGSGGSMAAAAQTGMFQCFQVRCGLYQVFAGIRYFDAWPRRSNAARWWHRDGQKKKGKGQDSAGNGRIVLGPLGPRSWCLGGERGQCVMEERGKKPEQT